MSNEINSSYQKLIDGFTMTRTKDGKGRGVRVNERVLQGEGDRRGFMIRNDAS